MVESPEAHHRSPLWDGPAVSNCLASDGKRRSAGGGSSLTAKAESDTALLAIVGIDIGKELFRLVRLGADGKTAFHRKIRQLGPKDGRKIRIVTVVGHLHLKSFSFGTIRIDQSCPAISIGVTVVK